jgi:hypothetical protein
LVNFQKKEKRQDETLYYLLKGLCIARSGDQKISLDAPYFFFFFFASFAPSFGASFGAAAIFFAS